MFPPLSREQADQFWLQATKDLRVTTDVIGVIAVRNHRDDARRTQGGRLSQRMHFWGTT